MEGMDKIKAKILQDASSEADAIVNRAKRETNEILTRAEKAAERKTREIEVKAQVEAEEAHRKIMSMSELELRKSLLAIKQEMLDLAFDSALDRLKALEGEEYEKVIAAMLEKSLQTGLQEIVVSPQDAAKFTPQFLQKLNTSLSNRAAGTELRLSAETRDIRGGFILKSQGMEINNSFEALIRLQRDEIESDIAKILFDE
jgi:V/A-type H+-transporting ATPase subunit E